jgi:outer membrane lipoprotein-sorting protein
MNYLSRFRVVPVVFAALVLSGCLFRTRKVERQVSAVPLKSATQQELIGLLGHQASAVKSMQATVDIDTSVGGAAKGSVTDYKQILGYVLARKPQMLRMIGLTPIVRNKAFDMVSDGKQFQVWVPVRNKFVVGSNSAPAHASTQALENLRPQAIYDALLIPEVGSDEIAVVEHGFETVTDAKRHRVDQPDYELNVIRKGPEGWYLSRKVVFSRTDLLPHRQLLYNSAGELVTDAHYESYKDREGISFPNVISIYRPKEEYDITLTMVKLQLNATLTDDQFVLQQPPGAEVLNLDQPQAQQPGHVAGQSPPQSR